MHAVLSVNSENRIAESWPCSLNLVELLECCVSHSRRPVSARFVQWVWVSFTSFLHRVDLYAFFLADCLDAIKNWEPSAFSAQEWPCPWLCQLPGHYQQRLRHQTWEDDIFTTYWQGLHQGRDPHTRPRDSRDPCQSASNNVLHSDRYCSHPIHLRTLKHVMILPRIGMRSRALSRTRTSTS